ncbi:MAG: NHLP bacteriocin export ABC transporter permease/ATPase subunit [Alphaproteobacteria bacterium]|nr:NHLP bacteriocin export ABC transporter permease/ATPase subunit [Alphaproteobacteria bacterium]
MEGEGFDHALLAACATVAQTMGETVVAPPPPRAGLPSDPIHDIARASGLQVRQVALDGAWWTESGLPLVAIRDQDGERRPVALLPRRGGGWDCRDPVAGLVRRVTAADAPRFEGAAFQFFRRLPDRPVALREVLGFAIAGHWGELRHVLLWGLLAGVLALATPWLVRLLFDQVLPHADIGNHLVLVGGLVMTALGVAIFEICRGLSLLRLQGLMDGHVQAAIWDRMLRLPAHFFRKHLAGDLCDRAIGVTRIREMLVSTASQGVIGLIFALTSLIYMFVSLPDLALVAFGVALVASLVIAGVAFLQLPHQHGLFALQGKAEGFVFQVIGSMAKLRVGGAEAAAFSRWAGMFLERKRLDYAVRRLGVWQKLISEVLPLASSLVLFAYVGGVRLAPGGDGLDLSSWLAFNAAFGHFMASLAQTIGTATTFSALKPLYRRAETILHAVPECAERRADPGELAGAVEFRAVTFAYDEQRPVLNEVSFHIQPGEHVAFVGPSGAGKSTLLRLLLGLEKPGSGGIYLDGRDLDGLDLPAVRRQIGVVLQAGRLAAGSILENLIGAAPLTEADAWHALRLAGLDADVRAMPMGLGTVLTDSGSTLSGGQRQRLLIARALVRRPRILVFDEATSALDNRTQDVVKRTLGGLNMTRIVVAHRLSTIEGVNRIYVVERGRIVESGTHRELLARGGAFTKLAERQRL